MFTFESKVNAIDNDKNRSVIVREIINEYVKQININHSMEDVLLVNLNKKSLFELMSFEVCDCSQILWNNCFDLVKESVCERVAGAKAFFEVGDTDDYTNKYYGDYYNMIDGILNFNLKEFMDIVNDTDKFNDLVNKVSDYVKKFVETKFKWVCHSLDGYDDVSKGTFNCKKDCYDDMRNAVLEKMKWNTQYDEDFPYSEDVVNYKVRFTQDMIIHCSFSGTYVYKIIPADEFLSWVDIFTEDFVNWLKKADLYW